MRGFQPRKRQLKKNTVITHKQKVDRFLSPRPIAPTPPYAKPFAASVCAPYAHPSVVGRKNAETQKNKVNEKVRTENYNDVKKKDSAFTKTFAAKLRKSLLFCGDHASNKNGEMIDNDVTVADTAMRDGEKLEARIQNYNAKKKQDDKKKRKNKPGVVSRFAAGIWHWMANGPLV